ncbi:MAG: class I SAM-dependent methyltransferase [Chloroflexota bacterium]
MAKRRMDERISRWEEFYQATEGDPPCDTLVKALDLFASETVSSGGLFAVDLGCGSGIDSLELLRRGWRVLAVDSQPEAIQRLRARLQPEQVARLETQIASFEDLVLPQADLVNASFSVPYCAPHGFDLFWSKIVMSIRAGGRFAGQFFGLHDGWAHDPTMTFHSQEEVKKLLSQFNIETFDEIEEEGKTSLGQDKYWHIFHVVARKAA